MSYDRSGSVPYKANGNVPVSVEEGSVTLTTTDIEVGGVEIKNGTDDTRATVTPANALKVDGSGATQPVSISGTVPVSGSVTVTSAPTTAVTGPLTDTQLRASAVPVSGSVSVSNLPATQPISGSVSVSNFPATQPVSLATNTPDVTDRSARLLGHVTVDAAPTTAITAASLPLPTGAALDATLTSGSQKNQLVDNTGTALYQDGQLIVHDPQLRRLIEQLLIAVQNQNAILLALSGKSEPMLAGRTEINNAL